MKVFTFLTEGFETVEALAVVDILRRAYIETELVSITGNKYVKSAQNIIVEADILFDEITVEEEDVLFLPGGPGHKSYYNCEGLMKLLQEHNDKQAKIAAICAAPSILGTKGLLKGKKAVCFPGFEDKLEGAVLLEKSVRCVTDGNITTSKGMGTSIDLGLELVRLIKGEDLADSLAKSTQYVNE